MDEVILLGNGPSLSKFDDSVLKNDQLIISCNRIYLYDKFDRFSNNTILCLSDLSFKSQESFIKKISLKTKKIYIPEDFSFNVNDEEIITYNLKRIYSKDIFSISNINDFPFVKETCSVLFTIMFPLCFSLDPKKVKLYGFDGDYSNKKYFYKDNANSDYRWSKNEAKTWANNFKLNMDLIIEFCKSNKVKLIK